MSAESAHAEVKEPKGKDESARLEEMLSDLSPGDKVIVKRVHRDPVTGKERRPVCDTLEDFAGAEDLNSWLFGIAIEKRWPGGLWEYELDHRKPGVHGTHCYRHVWLELPNPPPDPSAAAAGPLNVLEVARQTKELLGSNQQQASPDKQLESITAALKVGADAATSKAPPPDGTVAVLKPLIDAAVARLLNPPPVADPLALIRQLRELGLIGQQQGEAPPSPEDQVSEVERWINLAARLRGPAGPAVEPTAVAVAKIFAPYVPQVLHTINNVVDVVRLRFGMPMPAGQPGAPPGPRQVGPPPIPPAVQQLIAVTQAAISRDDDGFFPAFAEGIVAHIVDGRNFLLAIQGGTIEEEQALLAVGGTGLLNPTEPRTRAWLIRFVHWLRVAKPMAAAPAAAPSSAPGNPAPAVVTGRCEKCQQEYRFDSLEEFHEDTRICDNKGEDGQLCAGNIMLVEGGSAA